MDSFLKEVKSHIKELVPDHCYRMWIEPVILSTHDAETIVLSVPNDFYVKRLKENYMGYFEEACFYRVFFVEQMKFFLITVGSTNPYFQRQFSKKLNNRKECIFFFLRFLTIFFEFL